MRRVALIVALVLAAGACGGDDDVDTGIVDRDRPVPAALQAFLGRVADDGDVAFTATYEVLRRFGGTETTVEVRSTPPDVVIRAGDVVVRNGEGEAALADVGIFAGFTTTNPARALEAAARREDAGEPEATTREVLGMTLDCMSVPVQGAIAITGCLTPEGIFGYVDDASVRYELTAYELTAGP